MPLQSYSSHRIHMRGRGFCRGTTSHLDWYDVVDEQSNNLDIVRNLLDDLVKTTS